MRDLIRLTSGEQVVTAFGKMDEIEQLKEIEAIVKKFEKKDDLYHKYIGRRFYLSFSFAIFGFFLSYYVLVTAIRGALVTTNSFEEAYKRLSEYIPDEAMFEATDHARPILTGYDYDYSQPLNFLYGNDADLKLNVGEKRIFCNNMSIMQASLVGIADPFVYPPLELDSKQDPLDKEECVTGESEENTITALISGFMHASPPTMQGISSVLSLPEDKNIFGSKIDASALNFYVTEIGLDFTQEEVWIP